MSFMLRVLCIVGAVATTLFITGNIRRKKVQIEDSIFWVLLSFALVIVAVFPRIATRVSAFLQFQSPSNFVFVVVIAILLAKLFSLSTEVSSLRHRLNELAQEEALIAASKDDKARERLVDDGLSTELPQSADDASPKQASTAVADASHE